MFFGDLFTSTDTPIMRKIKVMDAVFVENTNNKEQKQAGLSRATLEINFWYTLNNFTILKNLLIKGHLKKIQDGIKNSKTADKSTLRRIRFIH